MTETEQAPVDLRQLLASYRRLDVNAQSLADQQQLAIDCDYEAAFRVDPLTVSQLDEFLSLSDQNTFERLRNSHNGAGKILHAE